MFGASAGSVEGDARDLVFFRIGVQVLVSVA